MTDESQAVPAGQASPAPSPSLETADLQTSDLQTAAPEAPASSPMGPIAAEERIQFIDVLRGLALFGIIAANLRGFAGPLQVYMDPKLLWNSLPDRIAQFALEVLIQGKFITLFAFLFGVGFAVQLTRAQARGARFLGFYPRRLGALLLIGLVHELALWWGDILVPYALGGFFLLLFRKRTDRTVFIWALVLVAFPVLLAGSYVIAQQFGAPPPKPPDPAKTQTAIQEAVRVYGQGTFPQIVLKRIQELKPQYGFLPIFLPNIVGLFLLGVWTWRKGILQNLQDHVPLLRRTMFWGLMVGLPGNLLARVIVEMGGAPPMQPTPRNVAIWSLQTFTVPALSLGYASALALLYQNAAWRSRLAPFAAVGRTALSNYLFQSLVCTTLFYAYGFGLYGKGGPLLFLIPTLVIYALEVPLSQWWLRRYRFGPAEWVWRSMTYGAPQPFRR
jgi:uncharacterized protein